MAFSVSGAWAGDQHGQLVDATLQGRQILNDFVKEADAGGFFGAD